MKNPILWEKEDCFALYNEKQPNTEFIFDNVDKEFASLYRWRKHRDGHVCANTDSNKIEYAHVLLLGKKPGMHIDHINRNPCDNRRSNLRFVSPRENYINKEYFDSNNVIGVENKGYRFAAYARYKGKSKFLGIADTEEQAALIYDYVVIKLEGLNATTNYSRNFYSEEFLKQNNINSIDDILKLNYEMPSLEANKKKSYSKYWGVTMQQGKYRWCITIKGKTHWSSKRFKTDIECAKDRELWLDQNPDIKARRNIIE